MEKVVGLLVLVFLGVNFLNAEPVAFGVSRLFTDRAVLQRDAVVPVWGTAAPGTEVTLNFGDQHLATRADAGGTWRIDLSPMGADAVGKDLVVETSDDQQRRFSDVVVGDLWLCAGQSNMELGMAAIANRTAEMKDLRHPGLRLYRIPKAASGTLRSEVWGAWVPSDRPSVTTGGWFGFSAVAYTFGRRLQRDLGVPIGLIQAAYGGSPIGAWIPRAELSAVPALADEAARADLAFLTARQADPQARHPYDDPSDARDLGPSSIDNALVAPLGPLALRGVIWYQGETDVGDGPRYTPKMRTLISGWRREFHRADLPVYFVQIAPWGGYGGDSLPRFWEAQAAVLEDGNTGMALTVDVGEEDNIHPADKRPVGERLALQALAKTYGRAGIVADGPVLARWEPVSGGALVRWSATGGLTTRDGAPPTGFEVLVGDRWTPTSASLTPAGVVLPASGPVLGVRYAWSAFPTVNLTDAQGLPARPFHALK